MSVDSNEGRELQAPTFHDGEPTNLEAAALDALEWLQWGRDYLQRAPIPVPLGRSTLFYRLGRAIRALEGFLPDDEPVFTETPKAPEFGAVAEIVSPFTVLGETK